MRYDLTIQQVAAVRAMLESDAETAGDETLLADTLEGETDLHELTKRLLDSIERDEGEAAILKEQEAARAARRKQAEGRIESRRMAIAALLQCAGVDKLRLPEATLSVRDLPPKPIVTDPDLLPDDFVTLVRKPNMAAIKDAPVLPAGVVMDNGRPSLTVRRT